MSRLCLPSNDAISWVWLVPAHILCASVIDVCFFLIFIWELGGLCAWANVQEIAQLWIHCYLPYLFEAPIAFFF